MKDPVTDGGAASEPTPIRRGVLDALVDLGRRQGGLTTADLKQALPVDQLAPEAIALIVMELEDAGVPVDLDEDLLGFASGAGPRAEVAAFSAARIGDAEQPQVRRPSLAPAEGPTKAEPATPPPEPAASLGDRGAHKAVALAGLIVLVLLGLIFSLFGWA